MVSTARRRLDSLTGAVNVQVLKQPCSFRSYTLPTSLFSAMPDTLQGKAALVIGSSRGIGRAIAERLGRAGASVAVTYHASEEKAAAVVRGIEEGGAEAAAFQVDAGDLAAVRGLFEEVAERFGRLDVVVCNTAGTLTYAPTAEMSPEDFDAMFDVARGTYFALQEAARRIEDEGRIVCISSAATAQAMPGTGAYAGAKAAVEQYAFNLAKELGPRGVTVNVVSPGLTDTDGVVISEEEAEAMIEQTPMGRIGQPEDIADAVALLVSGDAHWVTGQNVRATGGIL
jgi:3-oxoacyl-[acyl-carrier protein] reductase